MRRKEPQRGVRIRDIHLRQRRGKRITNAGSKGDEKGYEGRPRGTRKGIPRKNNLDGRADPREESWGKNAETIQTGESKGDDKGQEGGSAGRLLRGKQPQVIPAAWTRL